MKPKYLVGYKGDKYVIGIGDNDDAVKIYDSLDELYEELSKDKLAVDEIKNGIITIYKLVPVEEKKVKEYR